MAGRPSSFKEEYCEQAERLCRLGATDAEIADFFETTERTVNNWKKSHPEFFQSLKIGKMGADMEVADKLFQRATGYEWVEEQAIKIKTGQFEEKVEIVEIRKSAPPDTTAIIFWLKNRRKLEWRDKQEVEHGVSDPIKQLLEAVNERGRPKPGDS